MIDVCNKKKGFELIYLTLYCDKMLWIYFKNIKSRRCFPYGGMENMFSRSCPT